MSPKFCRENILHRSCFTVALIDVHICYLYFHDHVHFQHGWAEQSLCEQLLDVTVLYMGSGALSWDIAAVLQLLQHHHSLIWINQYLHTEPLITPNDRKKENTCFFFSTAIHFGFWLDYYNKCATLEPVLDNWELIISHFLHFKDFSTFPAADSRIYDSNPESDICPKWSLCEYGPLEFLHLFLESSTLSRILVKTAIISKKFKRACRDTPIKQPKYKKTF